MPEHIQIDNNAIEYFKAIEGFGNSLINEKSVDDVYNNGMNVLLNFPSAGYVALFLINQESFEFEFNSVLPEDNKEEIQSVFQKIIESGTLGKSLQTGEISFFKDDAVDDEYEFIICPIVGSGGIIALVLMKINDKTYPKEHFMYQHIKMFSLLFGITIEKFTLQETYAKTQGMLDQMVATRTILLTQSKVKLGEKIETLKSDLTMTMPHEVRTPINQIIGSSNYLIKIYSEQDKEDSEDVLEIARDIYSSAERLKRLFENYLFFARLSMISTNMFEIQNLKKDITQSVKPVIYDRIMMNVMQAGRQDDIKIELADSPVAMGEEYVNKIVEELIENCYKYSNPGTGIEVFSFAKDKNYFLTFIDHGRGMTQEQIQSIDAYIQFDRRSHEQQGSGLGLSIVQRILDLHDGEFAVESDPGNYTRVMIKLPIPTDLVIEN